MLFMFLPQVYKFMLLPTPGPTLFPISSDKFRKHLKTSLFVIEDTDPGRDRLCLEWRYINFVIRASAAAYREALVNYLSVQLRLFLFISVAKMEMTTAKTVAVFAIIFGCFAVLYPKIFHPMVLHVLGLGQQKPKVDDIRKI